MRFFQFVLILIFTSTLFAQRQTAVDFTHIDFTITANFNLKKINGYGTYKFILNRKVDSVYLDAENINIEDLKLNGDIIPFVNSGKKIAFVAPEELGEHSLMLLYNCVPKQTVYFIGSNDEIIENEQIWTQGQGKYTSHWLPSFDDMNEKVEFDISILVDPKYTVITNGKLIDKKTDYGNVIWKFDMKKPMSSYLAAFAIGNFDKKELKSFSGIPIELYYEPKDSLKVEPTYRYTKEIFDFLEQEIAVPYPWQNYKQVPVQDFLYAGMENTGTTIFSNQYMIDSTAFIDKNYVNVNAHEMAHQWFGNLVTEESGKHHWLHEGFATYYAYLTEQHLFGDDYFYWKLYETANTLSNLSESGGGEALTNPNANSLTFYEKGAWALVMLREKVGEEVFRKGVKKYLEKHQFKNVTISDFLLEIEAASNMNLNDFKENWLTSEVFPWEESKTYLMTKSASLRMFFVEKHRKLPSLDFLNEAAPIDYKLNLINEFYKQYSQLDYKILLTNKETKIRQKGIQLLNTIPDNLMEDAEALINDESYLTKEYALYNLWVSFPKNRSTYLEQTKNIIGLPNKNIRLLWLTLALITPDYQSDKKEEFLKELNDYTTSYNHFEVRQLAFQYLSQIQAMNDQTLVNLIEASEHHVWQFKKSSRNLLTELANNESMKNRLLNISKALTLEQQEQLKRLIKS